MSNPTAKQKRWLEYVASQPCIASGFRMVQIHHIWGRETKVKGVGNIGHWAILPIWYCLHDVSSDHERNVTHRKKAFEEKYGSQAELWNQIYQRAVNDDSFNNDDLPTHDVVLAISAYRR